MRNFGERIVGECLLNLDGFTAVDELVDVRGHGAKGYLDRVRSVRATTAVIPAAGLGTRFLPVTKAVPKELLPIVDVPALQLVIDEAVAAGINHVVIVSNVAKPGIEDYVRPSPDVVDRVRASGRTDLADRLAAVGTDVKVTVTYQDQPRGLGHAVGCAREAVGDDPFVVMLPDELMGDARLLSRLCEMTDEKNVSAVGLMRVHRDQVSAYGVVTPRGGDSGEGPFEIVDVVEKPRADDAPSNLIIIGRYALTPEVFGYIDGLKPSANGELQLSDALCAQAHAAPILGVMNKSARYDTGTPVGWLSAVIDIALQRPDIGTGFEVWLREKLA